MVDVDWIARDIDLMGRIVLPASWRKGMSKNVVLIKFGNEIVVKERKPSLLNELEGGFEFSKRDLANLGRLKAAGAGK